VSVCLKLIGCKCSLKRTHDQLTILQVIDGAYDGAKLNCTDQAVLSDSGLDKNGYNVPLEIMPSGQFEPLYRTTLNVQVCQSLISTRHFLWVTPLIFFSFLSMHKRMENCQFFHSLYMEQLQWHTVKSLRSIHHHTSFSSIFMIKEM